MQYRLLGNSGLRVSEAALGIISARKLSQLQDNLASFDLQLSADQLKILDHASHVDLGFPYDFYAKDLVRGVAYGGMRDKILA